MLNNALRSLFGQILWLLVSIWTKILVVTFWSAYSVVTGYYLQVASLMSLAIITSWIFKALRWTFGVFPVWACVKIGKTILRVLTCKRYFNEKAVAGYSSFSVPQVPPKKSALFIRRKDKTHIGYATSVRLFNGINAVITAEHNIEEGCELYSPRTRAAISVNEFTAVFMSPELDIAILAGPNNWESVLGCGGAHFTTHKRLAKCQAQIYTLDDERWLAHSASVVGFHNNFAQVLSNTKPGHSGAGYFHGKTLLGVHKGHAGSEFNFNLMAPIPDIPGITSPQYVVESEPPQGLIFPEDVADQITSGVRTAHANLKKFLEAPGRDNSINSIKKKWKYEAWADMEDESGNAKAAASASTNALTTAASAVSNTQSDDKSSKTAAPSLPKAQKAPVVSRPTSTTRTKTPSCPDATAISPGMDASTGPSQQELMTHLMSLLVQKIDVSKIEKSVIDLVASKALKKPRGKRGSNRTHATGSGSLPASTPGKYQPPNKRSQVSKGSGGSPPNTIRENGRRQNGESVSVPNTLSWVKRLPVSDGPKSGPPRS